MAKRNENIVPSERREARKWTRVADYWPDESGRPAVNWERSAKLSDFAISKRSEPPQRPGHRGLLLPIFAVAAAILLSLWGSGFFGLAGHQQSAASATTSKGLVFGLCDEGGLTNCVASGDSFYLGGKSVRVAGIEAPQLYGAACPKEATLGQSSAVKLKQLLNSGELEMTRVPQDLDRFGLLLRSVSVDGKDVGRTMVREGLAREIGNLTRSWC